MTHAVLVSCLCAALLGLSAAGPARAAIAPATTGNGELFLNVYDSTARVSYAKDLGVTMDEFFIAGQPDAGLQRFWLVDDPMWDAFLGNADPAALQWSVNALDATGNPSTAGNQRLFTTVRQGDEAAARLMLNQRLTDGVGTAQAGRFFDTVNSRLLAERGQSTHTPDADPTRYDLHGSSWSSENDSGFGYYGKSGGLGPTLNNNAGFSFANPVGRSSWFYYVTRSGANPGGRVLVDEFDNLGHDGYWGFVQVTADLDATSPYLGKWLLSYTIAAAVPTAAQRSFAASVGRTELTGGFSVQALDGVAGNALGGSARPLSAGAVVTGPGLPALLPMPSAQLLPTDAALAAPAAAVPEPAALLSMAAGLAIVATAVTRRRRHP